MRKILSTLPFVLSLVACGGIEGDDSTVKAARGPHYLALGDSISFGYSPLVDMTSENVANGGFMGYPEQLAETLGYELSNPSCSGETTGSLIDLEAQDNGCHSGDNFDQFLKVDYQVSQLDYAKEFLKTYSDTKLVTISLGGNDVLLVQDECDAGSLAAVCKAVKLPGLIVSIGKNIVKIIKDIKSTGYTGQIVYVTNYARNYKDPIQTLALGLIQAEVYTLAHFHKFTVASGFEAFKQAAKDFNGDSCEAGLMIALPEGGCNQHPSEKGRDVLAQAVLKVLK